VPDVVAAPVKLGVKVSVPVPDKPVGCPDDVLLAPEELVPPLDELLPVADDPEQAAMQAATRMKEAMCLITPA
jgi:hypothetical protein